MKLRQTSIAAITAGLLVVPLVASATGPDGGDNWKMELQNPASATGVVEKTDNIELVAHLPIQGTTDMQFQRRTDADGAHTDLLFAGSTTKPADHEGAGGPGGLYAVDVTDPSDPQVLSGYACGGFHEDVGIYGDLVVLGHDGSMAGCDIPLAEGYTPPGPIAGAGVTIVDASDPTSLEIVRFLRPGVDIPRGPHNLSINNEAGLLYFAFQALGDTRPKFGWFDLNDLSSRPTIIEMRDELAPEAGDSCHDIGLAHGFEDALGNTRDLLFCAGVTATYIWDIADPRDPAPVAHIVNPGINIHHGARLAGDGKTLVLNDELAGAAAAAGCQGGAPTGALWFYDISVPEAPVSLGAASTPELSPTKMPCTSHFYNFIPGDANQVVTGWYQSGVIVHDFSALPQQPTTVARYAPDGANFWTAYAWHGHLYGASYATNGQGGIHILSLDGMEDLEPYPADEGTSWARWDVAEDELPGEAAAATATAARPAASAPRAADGWTWRLSLGR